MALMDPIDLDSEEMVFGKYRGMTIHEVLLKDPEYLGYLVLDKSVSVSRKTRRVAITAYYQKLLRRTPW